MQHRKTALGLAVVAALSAAGGGVAYQQTHKKQPKRKQLASKAKVKLPKRKKKKGPFGR